jgi:hypothetical protein
MGFGGFVLYLGKLQNTVYVLPAYNGDNFNRIINDTVKNTINPANAAPIALPNRVNGLIKTGVIGYMLKAFEQSV